MPAEVCVTLKVFNVIYDGNSGGSILCLKREPRGQFRIFCLTLDKRNGERVICVIWSSAGGIRHVLWSYCVEKRKQLS